LSLSLSDKHGKKQKKENERFFHIAMILSNVYSC
jgi:hypothetical protein